MKFMNHSKDVYKFKVPSTRNQAKKVVYEVGPGEEIDIPEKYAYLVLHYKLDQLKPVDKKWEDVLEPEEMAMYLGREIVMETHQEVVKGTKKTSASKG